MTIKQQNNRITKYKRQEAITVKLKLKNKANTKTQEEGTS